jgi:hypothetical protein
MFACSAIIAASTTHSRADTSAALAAIADTADRICGIVADKGQAGSQDVQGEIHAQLNGLARTLGNIGGSGAAKITTNEYQGLLQKDLPTTLEGMRTCKLQVLKTLQTTLLPGTAQIAGPGAPTSDLLQAPSNASSVDTFKFRNDYVIDLYSCGNSDSIISCYVFKTFKWKSRL